MTEEIERKFVPEVVPPTIALDRGELLRQGYVAEDGKVEVRLRVTADAAMLTVKAGVGRRRIEVEVPLSEQQADALWPWTEGRRIEKLRHRHPLDDQHIAEIDVYRGALEGLCTVEVEFETEAHADGFVPPDWFGTEVTGIGGWSNAALARNGSPLSDRPQRRGDVQASNE